MDSPSSVYSETSPPTPIPLLALQPPLFPSANYSSEPPGMIEKRSFGDVWADTGFKPWSSPKKVLKSMVTDDEFIIGSPQDSLLCRRRIWSRKAARGLLLNPGNWQGSVNNQIRYNAKMEINKEWREAHGEPLHRPEMFRSIDWNAPATFSELPVSPRTVPVSPSTTNTTACNTAYWSVRDDGAEGQITTTFSPTADASTASSTPSPPDSHLTSRHKMSAAEQTSSETSGKSLAPAPVPNAGPTVSIYSLARFVDAEAPGFFGLTSSTTSQSPSSDDFQIENAVIEHATLAMPIAIPPRGPSLLNLRVLEAGAASRARRPIVLDSDSSDSDSSSATTHHTNLMPATLELGVATAVRMFRPAPARLIVVRPQAEIAALETASALESHDGGGCSPRSDLWSKLKRKFHRG